MKVIISLACLIVLASSAAVVARQKEPGRLKPVEVNKKWGYADETGKIIIAPQFESARPFSEGLAAVAIGNNAKPEEVEFLKLTREYLKWGFIKESGQFVIQPQFYDVGDFSEGLARMKVGGLNGKWGFIDKSGKILIQPIYYSVDDFANGRARASIGELRIIGKRGSTVKVKFYGKHGYLDKRGKFTKTSFKERLADKGAG
jgi:hypothetical protein